MKPCRDNCVSNCVCCISESDPWLKRTVASPIILHTKLCYVPRSLLGKLHVLSSHWLRLKEMMSCFSFWGEGIRCASHYIPPSEKSVCMQLQKTNDVCHAACVLLCHCVSQHSDLIIGSSVWEVHLFPFLLLLQKCAFVTLTKECNRSRHACSRNTLAFHHPSSTAVIYAPRHCHLWSVFEHSGLYRRRWLFSDQ